MGGCCEKIEDIPAGVPSVFQNPFLSIENIGGNDVVEQQRPQHHHPTGDVVPIHQSSTHPNLQGTGDPSSSSEKISVPKYDLFSDGNSTGEQIQYQERQENRLDDLNIQSFLQCNDNDMIVSSIHRNIEHFQLILLSELKVNQAALLLKVLVKIENTSLIEEKKIIYSMLSGRIFLDLLKPNILFLLSFGLRAPMETFTFFANLIVIVERLLEAKLGNSHVVDTFDEFLFVCDTVVRELSFQIPSLVCLSSEFKRLRIRCYAEKVNDVGNLSRSSNNFRDISLYPTPVDFIDTISWSENRINYCYTDANLYQDIQFRLLREDFIEPLRDGLRMYKESIFLPTMGTKNNTTLFFYGKVKFLNVVTDGRSFGKIAYIVQMDASKINGIRLRESKKLLFGSLVLFSRDNFITFQLGIVADSNVMNLKRGLLSVVLVGEDTYGDGILRGDFIMAESKVYFEPVHQTLRTILDLPKGKIPMEKYLLVQDIKPQRPVYSRRIPNIMLRNTIVPIDNDKSWPPCSAIGLNESQYSAFKSSMRQEFVLIQGPPGTGKTYLGCKIVDSLLNNFFLKSPILILSVTNHALDKLMEGLLNRTTSVVRMGGQSKNKAVEKYNFKYLRRSKSKEYSYRIASLKGKMSRCYNNIYFLTKTLKDIENRDRIIDVLNWHKKTVLKGANRFENSEEFFLWLLGSWYAFFKSLKIKYLVKSDDNPNDSISSCSDTEYDDDLQSIEFYSDTLSTDTDEDISVDYSCLDEQNSFSLEMLEQIRNLLTQMRKEMLDDEIQNDLSKIEIIEKKLHHHLNDLDNSPATSVKDIINGDVWTATEDDKWRLYNFWIHQIHKYISSEVKELKEEYTKAANELREVEIQRDHDILMKAQTKVIGMTTNGAARNNELLKRVKPQIVLVEEASQALESHLLSSIPLSCEQLILIGDHRQLKPIPNSFVLANQFNLEVSLFERMITSGVSCNTLTIQRRMNPEIASLITPAIYPELKNHRSVLKYPSVLGINTNLYFINHRNLEEKDGSSNSFYNVYEARFLLSLCQYLLLQGYKASEITILSTYRGQQLYLQRTRNQYKIDDVLITTVDGYQGEESNIILLSLVRSNNIGKIGYLGIENRVCVALSRAKHGLYIIGNMALLKQNSELWNKVNTTLQSQEAIGDSLTLTCRIHGVDTPVRKAKDFIKVVGGGCNSPCAALIPCGHKCSQQCHPSLEEHSCNQNCPSGPLPRKSSAYQSTA